MAFWLMKSEPEVFSIDDLKKRSREPWDGVRNYQARNYLRDQMKKGDLAFFYHSNCNPPGIVGIMEIVREGYPDDSAFDPTHPYYDAKSDPSCPRWYRVDVAFKEKFSHIISLERLRHIPQLKNMALLQKGNRLSVMPVTEEEWENILHINSVGCSV